MGPDAMGSGHERRLHPATLMLAITKLGPQSLNMLPALAAIGVTGNWRWVAPAILLFIVFSLVTSLIAWWRFTWRVDADDIAITSGVFSRNHRTIPFDRIQDVNIEQGLIARVLGLAKVTLETGGGGGDKEGEGALNAIALEDARALRDHIRAHRSVAAPPLAPVGDVSATQTADAGAQSVSPGRLLFAMSPRRLVTAGLFNFSLAIVAVLFGVLQTFDDILPFDPFSPEVWIDFANRFGLEQWVRAHQWLTIIGSLIALLILGMLTGVIRMVMANWGFRLERTERGFRRTRGLTTRTDVVIPAARVQGAIISSGFIGRRFGWHSLALQSLASDGTEEADHVAAPFATLSEIDGILAELGFDRRSLEESPLRTDDSWQSVHWVDALGGVIVALGLAAAALIIAIVAGQLPTGTTVPGEFSAIDGFVLRALAGLLLAVAVVILLTSWLGWRNQRWTYDGRLLHIVRGAMSRQHFVLPARNVQSADLSIGPITRRVDAAALTLGVPGGRAGQHRISALSGPLARVLRARLLTAR